MLMRLLTLLVLSCFCITTKAERAYSTVSEATAPRIRIDRSDLIDHAEHSSYTSAPVKSFRFISYVTGGNNESFDAAIAYGITRDSSIQVVFAHKFYLSHISPFHSFP